MENTTLQSNEELRLALVHRVKLLEQASKDKELAGLLYISCKKDFQFFLNTFGWVYEPRALPYWEKQHNLPISLFPYQVEALTWLNDRYEAQEDGLVEKSRDMGATWMFMVWWVIWKWLFADNFDCLIGSKKEDNVDNGQVDSIFGKAEYFLEHLPPFLMPLGWKKDKYRNYLKIINPENKNTIIGEATNPNFSRSGRYGIIFLDEFAFVDHSSSIWQACGDSTQVRIPVSTPNGKGNKFAELALNGGISKFTLHWRKHPYKTQEWYDREKGRRTSDEIAQELDISYSRSTRGRVYGEEWDQIVEEKRLCDVPFDPMLPVDTSWDFGILDPTAIGFYQETKAGATHMIDYYENSGYSIDHYLNILESKAERKGYRYSRHYGDIDVKKREKGTGKSTWELMKNWRSPHLSSGVDIRSMKVKKVRDSITASKLLLRQTYVDKGLTKFIDAISNYHFEWDEQRQEFDELPYHDWSSHACNQFEYYAINHKAQFDNHTKSYYVPRRSIDPLATTTY